MDGEHRNRHCVILTWELPGKTVVVLYRHPSYNTGEFLRRVRSVLSEVHEEIIIIGDINLNILANEAVQLQRMFSEKKLCNKLCASVTTNYLTQIDVCFSNGDTVLASTCETYYSYHKGIYVNW